VLYLCAGFLAFFGFALLITAQVLFGWLVYGTLAVIISVDVAAMSWRIWDIVKHIKMNEQEEKMADQRSATKWNEGER